MSRIYIALQGLCPFPYPFTLRSILVPVGLKMVKKKASKQTVNSNYFPSTKGTKEELGQKGTFRFLKDGLHGCKTVEQNVPGCLF